MKNYKWELKYNNKSIGTMFFNKADAKKEFKRLWNLNLFGYTLNKL